MTRARGWTWSILWSVILAASQAEARSYRAFWIPSATAPEPGVCRFESETLMPMMKRDADRAGQFASYSIGTGCNVFDWAGFDFEAGFDWREASDVRANGFIDPAQVFARVTYGAAHARSDDGGWSVALGMDDIGFASGQNDFNVAYAAIQNRSGPLEAEVGAYSGSDTLKTGLGEKDAAGAMLALRRYWGRGELGAEWRSGRNRDGYGTLAARIQFNETFAATAGYAIANDRENMRDWLLVRLTLSQ